jgi:hypothetical protein
MALSGRKPTKSEKDWMDSIIKIGCIVCKLYHHCESPACIHHIEGKTKYNAHFKTIPLCPVHHQYGGVGIAIHAGKKSFADRYGTEYELLEKLKDVL